MTPEEWPIAGSPAPLDVPACEPGRGRLRTVRVDFFLDPAERLTEQERALMTAMLHSLLADTADELRALLPIGSIPANDQANAAIVDRLARAGLLDDAELLGLLLRRADQERIATAARARSGRTDARLLQGLVSHTDGSVAAAAMGLILAHARRRDRFGQRLVTLDDLTRTTAEHLVHACAAALRPDIAAAQGASVADGALNAATAQLLDRHDPERGEDALAAKLARTLDSAGAADDSLILGTLTQGEVAFVAHFVGLRAGIAPQCTAEELLCGAPDRVAALARLARLRRDVFAGWLGAVGDIYGVSDPAAAIASFDAASDRDLDAARNWLAAPPVYRAAVAALDQDRGQRAF